MSQKPVKPIKNEAMPVEVRVGYLAIAVFLIGLLAWAATIPLATGVIAPGVVNVEGDSNMVQHLNGGLVKGIHVKEGDLVNKGVKLISLDEKALTSKYNALKSQYILLLARSARLEATSLALTSVTYSDWLMERKNEADVIEAINHQDRIFQSAVNLTKQREATYQYRINQSQTQINSDEARLQSARLRAGQTSAELIKYQRLLAQGLVTRSQTLSLDNSYRELSDTQETLRGSIGATRELISQYKAELLEAKMLQRSEAAKQLDALQDPLTSLKKDLAVTEDLLEQTIIRAPISGYIVNLMINTIGGVITPGQTITEIVPNNKKLIIKANVSTKDRVSIKIGQPAEVRFSAFNQRSTPPVQGVVRVVSADRLIDPVTNLPYYSADIALTEDPVTKLAGKTIHPGMQAELIISTGERTTLDYLLSPLTQSFNRALREN